MSTIAKALAAEPGIVIPSEEVPGLLVPEQTLRQSWAQSHISIVTPSDRATFCFTKGYGKLVDRAAGSCFLPNAVSYDRTQDPASISGQLRLFHPTELLRLFGFPSSFSFPSHLSLRQRFNCIGNSVNVEVVRRAMRHLFAPSHCPLEG